MKDNLQDLIQYTFGLGIIDLVKIDGTATVTEVNAIADDKCYAVIGRPIYEGNALENIKAIIKND